VGPPALKPLNGIGAARQKHCRLHGWMKTAMRSSQKLLKFGNLEGKTKPTRLAVWVEHL
jgi:hypothetical protein